MGKKSKRQSRKKASRQTSTGAMVSKTNLNKTYEAEFNPDYSQTIKDLKRIGILASTFFAVLVLLSFFLR